MNAFEYFIQANCYILLFYVFYMLFLKRETFFNLNRIYLIASAGMALLVPILKVDGLKELAAKPEVLATKVAVQMTLVDPVVSTIAASTPKSESFLITEGLFILYFLVSGILLFRLIHRLVRIIYYNKNSKETAFSFFKRIVVSTDSTHSPVILKHEECHARQWHSVDVLFFELLQVFLWINPAIYGYQKAIKSVHEYLADQAAVKAESKANYAQLLLHHALGAEIPVLSNSFFNGSLLKSRIKMLYQEESSRVALLKYALSMLLLLAMLVFSSAKIEKIAEKVEAKIPDFNIEKVKDLRAQLTNTGNNKIVQKIKKQKKVKEIPVADTLKLDSIAQFPQKGKNSFKWWIENQLQLPEEASKREIGGEVIVDFYIDQWGFISDAKVLKDIGWGCGEEVVRLVNKSPRWNPAIADGNKVESRQQISVNFALDRLSFSPHSIEIFNVSTEAEYRKGGIQGLKQLLLEQINIPAKMVGNWPRDYIWGKFVVERDGSVSNIFVPEFSKYPSCSEDVLRALKMMPNWNPAYYKGTPIRVGYNCIISFKADNIDINISRMQGSIVLMASPPFVSEKAK